MKRYFIRALIGLVFSLSLILSSVTLAEPDTWTKKADMPSARSYLSTSVVNGKIYAIGGWDGIRFFSPVEEYDPVADKWTKKHDMPIGRWGLSTSVVNGKIYVIGGESNVVEEYDPVADKWTRKADMPTERTGLSTSAVNGKIYAIGGSGGHRILSTVEEYDTGFAGEGVEAKDKLATKWGKIKVYK